MQTRILVALSVMIAGTPAAAAPACPPIRPPVINLDVERFYGDKAGTHVEPRKLAAHDAAVAPLTAFLREITQSADKALQRTSPRARQDMAACALRGLEAWAKGGALLGEMRSQQAEYQRKWDFTGLALAYVKLRPFATATQHQAIHAWLVRLADQSRAFFDDPGKARNNHWYWLGLGLSAVGLESPRHWQMARAIMHDAARDITADGTLPKEMQRERRALFYHVFALMPLVVMAEVAASRGEDWYAFEGGALHRLVATTHAGLVTPTLFDRLAGTSQERPSNTRAGWLQLYEARFPGRLPWPHPIVADGHRWIGGQALLLKEALAAQPSKGQPPPNRVGSRR
jgi:poly(beta-D-mannuronate) lyase